MTRDEIYELVWQHPITHLAHRFGKSDVALGKLCQRLNIPVPPRGWWSKTRSKRGVKRTKPRRRPLPPPKPGTPDSIDLPAIAPDEVLATPPRRPPGPSKLAPTNPVTPLTKRPPRLHRGAKIIQRGYTKPRESGIDVRDALSERATLFVHLLCTTLDQQGHGVELDEKGLALVVAGQKFRLRIFEAPEMNGRMIATLQPDRFSSAPMFRCSDRRGFKAEEYIADAIVALEQKAAWITRRSVELAEQSAIASREQARRSRKRRRFEFVQETAEALDRLRKLENLSARLQLVAGPTGASGVDRLARELRSMIDEAMLALTYDALDAEIARLQLFADDD